MNNGLNQIIFNKRKQLKLTQQDVASYVGVSEGTVSRWESGDIRNMRRDRILLLSQILRLDPQVIMGNLSNLNDDLTPITAKEKTVLTAYREQPEIQPAVDRLLGIEEKPLRISPAQQTTLAAFGGDEGTLPATKDPKALANLEGTPEE